MALTGNGFTKGLLIGGLIGAGIALLYAPKSGEALRRDMGRKANGLKNDMGKYMRRLRKSSDQLVDKARETVEAASEAVIGRIGDEVREGVRTVKEVTSKTRSH